MQKYFLALVACCSLSAPLMADPFPTFTATSGDFNYLFTGVAEGATVDLFGSNFDLHGGSDRLPAAPIQTIPGDTLGIALTTPTGEPPEVEIFYSGSLQLDGITYSVRYSGSATVTPTESIVVPTSGPSSTVSALLSGNYVACIGTQTLPDPCAGPGITPLANVTAINIPGVITYHFTPPNPAGINTLDGAVFTSIPEPLTFGLLFTAVALGAVTRELYCTMRHCFRRNAGVS